jgi:hypothetical protein
MVIRFHRWVVWWFGLGVFGGILALGNIFLLDLTRQDERVILLFGLAHWLLGGLVCWALEGVKLETERQTQDLVSGKPTTDMVEEPKQNVASDLIARQNRQMSPRHSRLRQEMVTVYLLQHWEHKEEHRA